MVNVLYCGVDAQQREKAMNINEVIIIVVLAMFCLACLHVLYNINISGNDYERLKQEA